MSTRRSTKHLRCPRCFIHETRCMCHLLIPQTIKHHVSLIVHVRELKLTSNTARFVHELLPDNSKMWVRGRVNEPFDAKAVLDSHPGEPFYLFPDPGARVLDQEFLNQHQGPIHLIVPDGSWSQARKFKQREPLFKAIPSVVLAHDFKREYLLRKSLHENWLSTFEASVHALGALGELDAEKNMMIFFREFVQRVLNTRYTPLPDKQSQE